MKDQRRSPTRSLAHPRALVAALGPALVLVFVLVLAGCARASQDAAPPDSAAGMATATATATAGATATHDAPGTAPGGADSTATVEPTAAVPMVAGPAEVPGRAAELMGKSCRNAPRRAERCRICDGDVIVGVVMPGDLIGIPDDDPYRVRVGGSEPEAVHVVAVGGGLLRAHMLTCPICRRKMGWGMVVQLDAWTKLPAPLRVTLQQAAGYEAADPLSVAELGQPPTRAPTAKAPSCEAPRAP